MICRLIAIVLGWCLVSFQARAAYEVVEFETGAAVQQSALIDSQSLYVFSSNDDDTRHYQAFSLASGESTTDVTALPDSLIFVDELMTSDGTEIALIHRDRVSLLGNDETLLGFTSLYNAPVFQRLPRFNVFRDLNGDGLDDFLIPTFEGYQVSVQAVDGTFSQVVSLEATPLMDMSYNSHPWYQAKSIFLADMTGDGLRDIAFWQNNQFRLYPQQNDGSFSVLGVKVPGGPSLDYDSVDGMSLRFSNEDQSNKTVKVIHSLGDYDGDGVTDLMAMEVKSEGVLNKTTTFALHLGSMVKTAAKNSDYVAFSEQPASGVRSNGIQYEMFARDLEGDGDLDLMISSVELGVGKIIGALLTSSIKIDLGFYPMTDGLYPDKPATTRNITASFSLSSGEYWLPTVQLLDHDLDGRLDLMIQDSEVEMSVYPGESSDRLFATRGEVIRVAVPKDPDLIRQVDINQDGVKDLLMQVPPAIGETSGHRVVVLQSRQN